MKRVIYMALTLASALSIGGCSTAITTKDLTMIEEAEGRAVTQPLPLTDERNDKTAPTLTPAANDTASVLITKAPAFSELTFELEGNKEVVSVRDYISSLGYQIKMDEERFTYDAMSGYDIFTASNPDPTVYPDIYIKISNIDKITQSNYIEDLNQQLLSENPQLKVLSGTKLGDYDALTFQSNFGTEYNSAIKKVYVIESENGYFTIETQYFLEAEEGYGARIRTLLDTLVMNEN